MPAPPDGGIRASEWRVHAVTHRDALGFLRRYHYARDAAKTAVYRHGLFRPADCVFVGDLLGVAMWMPPVPGAAHAVGGGDWRGVLALTRLAVDESCPTNAASFLLGRSMRLIDRHRWPILVTYADTGEGHTGAIYRATNWRCDGITSTTDRWVDDRGRMVATKRGPRTRTVEEMVALGYTRERSDKIRFVHDVRPVYGPPRPRQRTLTCVQ